MWLTSSSQKLGPNLVRALPQWASVAKETEQPGALGVTSLLSQLNFTSL